MPTRLREPTFVPERTVRLVNIHTHYIQLGTSELMAEVDVHAYADGRRVIKRVIWQRIPTRCDQKPERVTWVEARRVWAAQPDSLKRSLNQEIERIVSARFRRGVRACEH